MNMLRRFFENGGNKALRKLLEMDEGYLKKDYYTINLGMVRETGKNRYETRFEVIDGNFTMELSKVETNEYGPIHSGVIVQKLNSDIVIRYNGQKMKLNKELMKQVFSKYENILLNYQMNQEERYSQFIKELNSGQYSFEVRTLGSEGIEEGKEITLSTNQGINLIFTREPHSLIIKVKDSEELYLRRLEYSMDKESFTNAKIRKLTILPDEKEQLISFIKRYLDSKDITNLFTEEEILLSKINA